MKILVINCGSSSIKYGLFDTGREEALAEGIIEKIGEEHSIISQQIKEKKFKNIVSVKNHRQGLDLILNSLRDSSEGTIKDISAISAVGHRVVHGGSDFVESTVIDSEVIKSIRKYRNLAPLHNPSNLVGIEVSMSLLPDIPHVAVFDTAFHQSIPEVAYIYPVPYKLYEKYGIRRYGFHGTSHRHVSQRAAKILGKPLNHLRIITCHLGNGCSVTAVHHGKSVDTSMGLTPLEGLPMGTRCGDIDPSITFFLAEEERLTLTEINDILNKKSGLLGISGISNDIREIRKEAKKGNFRAKLALDIFAYRIKKYIGAYATVLGGVDVIVFTGGIGENANYVRSKICQGLGFLGIRLDEDRNKDPVRYHRIINTEDSPVKILVIPAREDLIIARETLEAIMKHA